MMDEVDAIALRELIDELPDDGVRYHVSIYYDHDAVAVGKWEARVGGEDRQFHTRAGVYGLGMARTLAEAADECRRSLKGLD